QTLAMIRSASLLVAATIRIFPPVCLSRQCTNVVSYVGVPVRCQVPDLSTLVPSKREAPPARAGVEVRDGVYRRVLRPCPDCGWTVASCCDGAVGCWRDTTNGA